MLTVSFVQQSTIASRHLAVFDHDQQHRREGQLAVQIGSQIVE
jgi:hypothetical protein